MRESSKLGRYYVLITSVKNEGKNLPELIQSIVKQTIKPVLWIIMDDGSTDNTPEILKEVKEKYDWIQDTRLDSEKRDLGLHLSHVIKRGFDFAIEYCMKGGIDYEYLGNVDGDMILEPTFFENILKEFEKDPKLGIASGGTNYIIGNRVMHAKLRVDEPSGGHMLIRRKCFERCGGIFLSYAWDSVLKTKAGLKGWKTKRFEENTATEIRDVSSAEGYWKGFIIKGKSEHYLNYNPFIVVAKGLKYCLTRQNYKGVAYLYGYFGSLIQRKEQINDEEIRKYFYWCKPREIWQYYWNVFKNRISKYLGGEHM